MYYLFFCYISTFVLLIINFFNKQDHGYFSKLCLGGVLPKDTNIAEDQTILTLSLSATDNFWAVLSSAATCQLSVYAFNRAF